MTDTHITTDELVIIEAYFQQGWTPGCDRRPARNPEGVSEDTFLSSRNEFFLK